MEPGGKSDKIWLRAALLYAIVVILLGACANYRHPYSPDPVTTVNFRTLFLWVLLYVPVIVLPLITTTNTAKPWRMTDFGFTFNVRMALITLVCILVSLATLSITTTWTSAILEAFARTGEEVFFRGFLLVLFTRLFAQRRHPRRWAILLSAFLFALVHTQTFRPEFRDWYSSPMPLAYSIINRLFDLFLTGLIWGLLCTWMHSILPVAIIHSALKSSILTLPFVLLIYGSITFWAHKRGEQVVLHYGVPATTQ